jgi:DNA-binding CsgD family transcriptional regulator
VKRINWPLFGMIIFKIRNSELIDMNDLNVSARHLSRLNPPPGRTQNKQPERYAQLELTRLGQIIATNQLADQLLLERTLLIRINETVSPASEQERSAWFETIASCAYRIHNGVLLLQGEEEKIPVLVLGRDNHRVEVLITVNESVSAAMLDLACASFKITQSERLVLRMILRGTQPKAIAKIINRTESTVRSHIKGLLAKCDCGSIQELITLFLRLPELTPI